jgi:hypothetical protein
MDGPTLKANQNAPVYSEATIEVDATREVVWALMADVENWPAWNPEITEARLDGTLAPGARIVWKSGPGTIRSELADVVLGERLSWTGTLFGIRAIHVWTLSASDHHTRVTTHESWDGLPVRLFRRFGQRTVEKALLSGLKYLKDAAEKKSAG